MREEKRTTVREISLTIRKLQAKNKKKFGIVSISSADDGDIHSRTHARNNLQCKPYTYICICMYVSYNCNGFICNRICTSAL